MHEVVAKLSPIIIGSCIVIKRAPRIGALLVLSGRVSSFGRIFPDFPCLGAILAFAFSRVALCKVALDGVAFPLGASLFVSVMFAKDAFRVIPTTSFGPVRALALDGCWCSGSLATLAFASTKP